MEKTIRNFLIKSILFYQIFISFDKGILRIFAPGGACRYNPTCSEYMKEAVSKYGISKGVLIGIRRILSCNPWIN